MSNNGRCFKAGARDQYYIDDYTYEIRQLMEAANISVSDMARVVHRKYQYVSDILRGTKTCSRECLTKMHRYAERGYKRKAFVHLVTPLDISNEENVCTIRGITDMTRDYVLDRHCKVTVEFPDGRIYVAEENDDA